MFPTKKVHLDISSYTLLPNHQPDQEDENNSQALNKFDSLQESSKKTRKRRTLGETTQREFLCGCGKNYVSYPAIYLHVQNKHQGTWLPNTVIPEKHDNQDKVKRGRPKVREIDKG